MSNPATVKTYWDLSKFWVSIVIIAWGNICTDQKVTCIQRLLCRPPALVSCTSWGRPAQERDATGPVSDWNYYRINKTTRQSVNILQKHADIFQQNRASPEQREMRRSLTAESDPLQKHQQSNYIDYSHSSIETIHSVSPFQTYTDLPFSGWYKVAVSGQGSAAVDVKNIQTHIYKRLI